MKKLILLLFASISCTPLIHAQDIEVKKMKEVTTASVNAEQRQDLNGTASALVRVQFKETGAIFVGNIIGDVAYKDGEYWVYMSQGSKRLSIKHPDYLPVTIVFSNLGIAKVSSGVEYQMLTKANKEKTKPVSNKKGMAVFSLTPSNAVLAVDGECATSDGGGVYSLSLPYGTHYYSVSYNDFSVENQVVKIDKEPKTISVDLTEYFAHLTVNSKVKDAAIYINDELRGIGTCDELVTPGQYVIQARKEGFHILSQTVALEDNETFAVQFDDMKAIVGTLKVDYEPIGSEVYLDGHKVGITPLVLNNVMLGRHKLEIKKGECKPESRNINISEDKGLAVRGCLDMMSLEEVMLNEAAKGDACAMNWLGFIYAALEGNMGYICDCFYRFYEKTTLMYNGVYDCFVKDKQKGIDWFKKAANSTFSDTCKSGKYRAMLALCYCYIEQRKYADSFYWVDKCFKEYSGKSRLHYYFLAWHYYYGYAVEKDVYKAKVLLYDFKKHFDNDSFATSNFSSFDTSIQEMHGLCNLILENFE